MPTLAQRLIKEERRAGNSVDTVSRAAFRVCGKLRGPLSTFAGAAGFRSLMARAMALARPKSPWLEGIRIKLDGTFEFSAAAEAQLDTPVAGKAATALTEELFGLLRTFIGEALTLRLVRDVWPKVALKNSDPEGK